MNFDRFQTDESHRYCYYKNPDDTNSKVIITNAYITDFIREIEPNGLIEDNYIIKWSNGQEFQGNKSKIITDLVNSNIFYNRKIINEFIDKLFAYKSDENIKENIKGTYLNQDNIKHMDIDIDKLNKAVELYNQLIAFVPLTQKELCKALWIIPIHYILKTTAPIKRGLIYAIVTNGVTGSSKTFLTNLHKLMFESEYNAPSFEDVEPLGSYAGIRNKISSQGGFIILDEMDDILINGEYFNTDIRNLFKNVIKIYLPNVADKEQQGHNTDYYYLGTPIANLNSEIVLESAEKERVLYFNMVECCNIEDLQVFNQDDIDTLRELGKAYYNVVKDLDFSNVKSELDVRRLILDQLEQEYNISFNTILKLPIRTSNNDNNIQEKVLNNIQYHCGIAFDDVTGYSVLNEDLTYFDWLIETKKGQIKVNSKLFNRYLSKLTNDNTLNYRKTCEEIGLGNPKSIRWLNNKVVDGYLFQSRNDFLDSLNFKDYLYPSND